MLRFSPLEGVGGKPQNKLRGVGGKIITGKKARINHQPVHSADMASTRANIQKAQTMLGWQPQVTTYQGLKNIIAQPQLLRFNC